MAQRLFLGWNQPFVGLVADYLLSTEEALESTFILVPTAQSARQLKHRMASQAGAILSPKFSTPGGLMGRENPTMAPNWLEKLAWQEILETKAPKSALDTLFSESAQTRGEWASGMASEMVALRRSLQDNGLSLRDVARRLSSTPESERWDALASIESMVDSWLEKQGSKSRTRLLSEGIQLPEGIERVILAGVSELPPLVTRALEESPLPVISLIAAPQELCELFDEIGTPKEQWNEQPLDWPGSKGSVQVVSDPRQQAREARALAAITNTKVEAMAIGTADTDAGDLIAHEFTAGGWPTHHPAAIVSTGGLRRWLQSWSQWLNQADLSAMMDLISLPISSALIESDCAEIADSLARLRDRWMVIRPDDLRHQLSQREHRSLKREALDVVRACEKLEHWRKLCLESKPTEAMRHLLSALNPLNEESTEILDWIDEATSQMNHSRRSMSFWIELMLGDLPQPSATPPPGRVLDIHGWLELLFQPGSHLILCGLNEGRVPAARNDDPWLGESGRTLLDLHTDKKRAARDAFLLQSMIHSRLDSDGRVDLLCTRTNEKGEPQLPSRLLLAAKPEETAGRIEQLFKELEPVDAKLRWETEEAARWSPPSADVPESLNATSFRDYLACPFRYYLKHIHRMRGSEPDRIEWNARDFGNVIHDVLEAWGRDQAARQLNEEDEIRDWLNQRLDQQVQSTFNQRIPLAVRIQLDAIRQRLTWFSQVQQELMNEGWRVIEVEHEFAIPVGETTVSAKIDRIDRHCETGEMRIIDYKTGGKASSSSSAHRTKQSANSKLPEHIQEDDPAIYIRNDGDKDIRYLWKDLQLPLYVLAIHERDQQLATPCYFKLGETRSEVSLNPWQDFDLEDLEAAKSCACWVSERIAAKRFWPISQKVTYDDYDLLWCSHSSDELISEPIP